MSNTGHVENGAAKINTSAPLPDGVIVDIEPVGRVEEAAEDEGPPWTEVLKDFIGSVEGLPPDFAENHDHYIHGARKRGASDS